MMDEIKRRYQRLADRVDALGLRERAMVFVAVMAVLLFIAAQLVVGPLNNERKRMQREIQAKNQQTVVLNAQIQAFAAEYSKDPNAANRAELATLRGQLQATKAALGKRTQGLVSPKEMVRLVEQVLKQNRALELVSVRSLQSVPLFERPQAKSPTPATGKTTRAVTPTVHLYKHGMRIQFRGRYRDVVAYLQALEKLPWKVFWGRVTLTVESYPVSLVTLELYTLSRQSEWIGL
jgi:MSHA biogenesis protein MshJ